MRQFAGRLGNGLGGAGGGQRSDNSETEDRQIRGRHKRLSYFDL